MGRKTLIVNTGKYGHRFDITGRLPSQSEVLEFDPEG